MRRWWKRRRFVRSRRRLEYIAFISWDPRWGRIRKENDVAGVWRRA